MPAGNPRFTSKYCCIIGVRAAAGMGELEVRSREPGGSSPDSALRPAARAN